MGNTELTLRVANLSDDRNIKDFSCAIASGALVNLKDLSVANYIKDMSALSLAIASETLSNITCVHFTKNQMDVEGMSAFSSAMANGALAKLDVCKMLSTSRLFFLLTSHSPPPLTETRRHEQ